MVGPDGQGPFLLSKPVLLQKIFNIPWGFQHAARVETIDLI